MSIPCERYKNSCCTSTLELLSAGQKHTERGWKLRCVCFRTFISVSFNKVDLQIFNVNYANVSPIFFRLNHCTRYKTLFTLYLDWTEGAIWGLIMPRIINYFTVRDKMFNLFYFFTVWTTWTFVCVLLLLILITLVSMCLTCKLNKWTPVLFDHFIKSSWWIILCRFINWSYQHMTCKMKKVSFLLVNMAFILSLLNDLLRTTHKHTGIIKFFSFRTVVINMLLHTVGRRHH